jgi:hypothetical protein
MKKKIMVVLAATFLVFGAGISMGSASAAEGTPQSAELPTIY